jgi:ferritin-like metal-binding protein YciE
VLVLAWRVEVDDEGHRPVFHGKHDSSRPFHGQAGDEILKNTFGNNAFEHFEIAAYKSLLALCGPAGAETTKSLLEQSLKEEEAMASWVDQNVANVTLAYLNKERAAA